MLRIRGPGQGRHQRGSETPVEPPGALPELDARIGGLRSRTRPLAAPGERMTCLRGSHCCAPSRGPWSRRLPRRIAGAPPGRSEGASSGRSAPCQVPSGSGYRACCPRRFLICEPCQLRPAILDRIAAPSRWCQKLASGVPAGRQGPGSTSASPLTPRRRVLARENFPYSFKAASPRAVTRRTLSSLRCGPDPRAATARRITGVAVPLGL